MRVLKLLLCAAIFLSTTAFAQTTVGSDGTIYHRTGNTSVGSDGSIIHHHGNTSISSNGNIYHTHGSITTGSDGSIRHNTGWGSPSSTVNSSRPRRSSSTNYNPSPHYNSGSSSNSARPYYRSRSRARPSNPWRSYSRNTAAKPNGKFCYCLMQQSDCVMGRPGDKHVLEALQGMKCSAKSCAQGMKWSLKNVCSGKWRPFLQGVEDQAGDADGDQIKNAIDLCPDTPQGSSVWQHGKWTGCAGGQVPMRTLY